MIVIVYKAFNNVKIVIFYLVFYIFKTITGLGVKINVGFWEIYYNRVKKFAGITYLTMCNASKTLRTTSFWIDNLF